MSIPPCDCGDTCVYIVDTFTQLGNYMVSNYLLCQWLCWTFVGHDGYCWRCSSEKSSLISVGCHESKCAFVWMQWNNWHMFDLLLWYHIYSCYLLAPVADVDATTPTETVTESPSAESPAFYTQAPFIAGVVVLCLLLLFLCFVGLLCFVRPSGPYSPSPLKSMRGDGTMRASWSPGPHDEFLVSPNCYNSQHFACFI